LVRYCNTDNIADNGMDYPGIYVVFVLERCNRNVWFYPPVAEPGVAVAGVVWVQGIPTRYIVIVIRLTLEVILIVVQGVIVVH